jgi:YidC/Oxa1 family membrane protein insertase
MFSPPLNLLESVCAHGDEVERDSLSSLRSKIEDQDPTEFASARWMGVDSRYFMSAFNASRPISCAQSDQLASLNLHSSAPSGFSPLSTTGKIAQQVLEAHASFSEEVTVYGGPKKLELLDAAEPKLGNAIDFGIFSPICLPMLWAMGLFFSFVSNWGIAIILLTVLVKLLTLPLTIKQYRSMAAMKKLQPLLAGIKEKYGDDPMRVQQETMALYKKEGVNPLAGCLPMLVMMPIYFALYRTIYSAVELYQARFFGWLTDLSMPDPYFITPVVLAGLMFLQSQLQPTNSSMDAAQRRLLTVFMPLMFGAMMLFLPSGLVLYILVNTVLGLVQQQWTNRQAENA